MEYALPRRAWGRCSPMPAVSGPAAPEPQQDSAESRHAAAKHRSVLGDTSDLFARLSLAPPQHDAQANAPPTEAVPPAGRWPRVQAGTTTGQQQL